MFRSYPPPTFWNLTSLEMQNKGLKCFSYLNTKVKQNNFTLTKLYRKQMWYTQNFIPTQFHLAGWFHVKLWEMHIAQLLHTLSSLTAEHTNSYVVG
jgi:hypothetical protein